MTFSRAALLKITATLKAFDPAASAYIGLQWGVAAPLFHRAGRNGYMETIGYRREPPALIVSLLHLRDSLNNLQDDEIDLADQNGILTLTSNRGYVTELKVHTLWPNTAWSKAHVSGKPAVEIQADAFKGIKTDGFTLAASPVLRNNTLMLATDYGIVMRDQVPVKIFPYPRESFLRVITSLPIDKLFTTDAGYWAALGGGFHIAISGHRMGDALFDSYAIAATFIADLPAARLTQSLAAAANLAADNSRVILDPALGIIVRDEHQHDNRFSIGESTGWSKFSIMPRTAKVLAEAFSQAKEETIGLAQVDANTMRLTRGPWQVNFKTLFPK